MKYQVSIVVIGRNEEKSIKQCLDAASLAAARIGGAEIIYVDSASTDATIEIAAALGARVLPLDPAQRLCPSAGRYAGSQAATGEFILFLDADTHIYRDFLPVAIAHLQANPKLAGVNGQIDDTDESGVLYTDVEARFETTAEIEWLRGPACFYRRAALIAAGSFNPHLMVEEEAELGLRLLKNGWRINLLPIPMACHTRCYHNQTFTGIFDSLRRDRATGRLGEIVNTIVCAHRQGFGWRFCQERLKTTIGFTLWLLSLFVIGLLPLPSVLLEALGSILIVFGFVVVWYKKRDLYQTALFFPAKFLSLINILAGIPKIKFKNF